jgi:hypothetical protein
MFSELSTSAPDNLLRKKIMFANAPDSTGVLAPAKNHDRRGPCEIAFFARRETAWG